jgi:hypothetical protein
MPMPPKSKKKKDRRLEIVEQWISTQKIAAAILKAGLKEPERVKQGAMREVASMLTHGLKVLRIVQVLDAEGHKVYLKRRRAEVVALYSDLAKLTKMMTKAILEDPLSAKATALSQINVVLRKSVEILGVLEEMEQAAADEATREQNAGSTPEELEMLAEYEEIEKEMDLESFNISSDQFESERLVD